MERLIDNCLDHIGDLLGAVECVALAMTCRRMMAWVRTYRGLGLWTTKTIPDIRVTDTAICDAVFASWEQYQRSRSLAYHIAKTASPDLVCFFGALGWTGARDVGLLFAMGCALNTTARLSSMFTVAYNVRDGCVRLAWNAERCSFPCTLVNSQATMTICGFFETVALSCGVAVIRAEVSRLSRLTGDECEEIWHVILRQLVCLDTNAASAASLYLVKNLYVPATHYTAWATVVHLLNSAHYATLQVFFGMYCKNRPRYDRSEELAFLTTLNKLGPGQQFLVANSLAAHATQPGWPEYADVMRVLANGDTWDCDAYIMRLQGQQQRIAALRVPPHWWVPNANGALRAPNQ